MHRSLIHVMAIFLLLAGTVTADTPQLINYQGTLLNSAGDPVADATYSVTFAIYDDASDGAQYWSEVQSITTKDGGFSVLLGSVAPIHDSVFVGIPRYLSITIDGDSEMDPRMMLVTVPWSFRTSTIDGATGGDITGGINISVDELVDGNALIITNGSGDTTFRAAIDQGNTSVGIWEIGEIKGEVSATGGTKKIELNPDGITLFGATESDTSVLIGAGTDILKVFDSDGDLRVKLALDTAAASDGGGAISFYSKATSNRTSTAGLPGEEISLVKIGESRYGTGEISTFDPDGNELTRITSTGVNGGAFYTYLPGDAAIDKRLTLQGQTVDSAGCVATFGVIGNPQIVLSSLAGYTGRGYLAVKDSLGDTRVGAFTDWGKDGHLTTFNTYGQTMSEISNTGYSQTENGGLARFWGANGSLNVEISHTPDTGNQGMIVVCDSWGGHQAGIKVDSDGNGIIWGDQKSFATPNPAQPGTELWYTSLEGPEAAAYIRGTANLINGEAIINFPQHFVSIASPDGLTAVVTPSSAESMGLAVVEKHADRIVVKELYKGSGNYSFDYTVTAVRKGFEDYQVVHPVTARRPLPKEANGVTAEASKLRNTSGNQNQ